MTGPVGASLPGAAPSSEGPSEQGWFDVQLTRAEYEAGAEALLRMGLAVGWLPTHVEAAAAFVWRTIQTVRGAALEAGPPLGHEKLDEIVARFGAASHKAGQESVRHTGYEPRAEELLREATAEVQKALRVLVSGEAGPSPERCPTCRSVAHAICDTCGEEWFNRTQSIAHSQQTAERLAAGPWYVDDSITGPEPWYVGNGKRGYHFLSELEARTVCDALNRAHVSGNAVDFGVRGPPQEKPSATPPDSL